MKARALRKRPGRKPKRLSGLPRRPGCRGCRFRAPSGACLDPVLTSGRCGDYVRYVLRNKQHRRLYIKPTNPRTFKQQRERARFRAASSKYSQILTEDQRDACIAEGAKLQSRPRLGQSGPLTGQQYSIRKEYAASAAARMRKARATTKTLQPQSVTRKYKSQVPQPQRFARSTLGTRRSVSGVPPGNSRRYTGRAGEDEGKRKNEGRGRQREKTALQLRQSQTTTRSTGGRHHITTWVRLRQSTSSSGTFPVTGKASVRARPNISRPLPSQGLRGRSPSRRKLVVS
jgi:hypothetical protein